MFFVPVKAGLPEVAKSDITGWDWAIGGAQAAMWAVPFLPKGIGPGLLTASGLTFSANTAKEWNNLSNSQRALSVAMDLAILLPGIHGTVKPSFKPVKVPIKGGGSVTVWSGLSVRGKPVIGISKMKPNVSTIEAGWRPITKLEASVLGTEKALRQMGVAQSEIDKVLATIKNTKSFRGTRSPYEPKSIKPGDVAPQALEADELSVVLRNLVENKKNVAQVYGSTTIKPQLAPELRDWRALGDIEAQLKNMTPAEAAKLTQKIVKQLNAKAGSAKFTIDADDPLRILKDGHHAIELKLAGADDLLAIEKLDSSTSSRTGTASWGMTVAENPISVNYKGVGELKIMRLSESGVRKTDTITRLAEGGTFAPPTHRIKDIADYYVILRTFKGEKVADAWAKAYGYDASTLLKQAEKNPLTLDKWALDLNAKAPSAAPSVSINLPAEAMATVKSASPALYEAISSPVTMAPVTRGSTALADSGVSMGDGGLLPEAKPEPKPKDKPEPSPKSSAPKPTSVKSPRIKTTTPNKSNVIIPASPSAKPYSNIPRSSVAASPSVASGTRYIPRASASTSQASNVKVSSKAIVPSASIASAALGSKALDSKSLIGSTSISGSPVPTSKSNVTSKYDTNKYETNRRTGDGKTSGGGGGGGVTDTTPRPTPYYPYTSPPNEPPPATPRPPHKIPLPSGSELSLTDREYSGLVAWRQGLFYIMVFPPYTKAQTYYSRKPVPGITYARGPESPQKSAGLVGGKLPRVFELAMGIAKVRVSPGGSKKAPQLAFSRRTTKVTPGLGEVRPSRGKSRGR